MQDDSRHRLDTSANEHGVPTRTTGFETQSAGHGYDIHTSLTESNLSRHTRLNPPDARDTVQWFLRGLPPDARPGGDPEQAGWTTDSRDNQDNPLEKVRRAEESHDHQTVRSAQEKRDGHQTQTSGRQQRAPSVPLVEQRKSLVTSMKSKHETSLQQAQKNKPASIIPSSKSSTSEVLRPRLLDQQIGNDDRSGRKVTVLAEDSQKTLKPKAREKHKHPETDSIDKHKAKSSRKAVRSSHVEPKDVKRKEKQKERALRSLAAEEVHSDRQQVLEQRKERRRAKAVIVKDRAKVTGPSEVVVKANKKAPKVTADEPSKYRESGKRDQAEGHPKQALNVKPSSRRKKARSDTSIEGSDSELKVHAPKCKKRSTDVERSMRALKDAAKGRRENGKRRRYDPLERATNILPAGRVTLKAKTGIYNHGQASAKHPTGADPPPKRLTDLAFSELPFLNPPIGESSKSRLLHKQDTSAYRIVASREKGDKSTEVRFTAVHPRSTCSTRSSTASDASSHTSESLLSLCRTDSRAKSPKLTNAKKHNAEREHGREAFRSPAKTHNAEAATRKPRTAHRTQGLSLESREAGSSVTTPSKNLTGESFSESSRKLSTVAESGQLSSLTGLSAGSLVRRRLLRRLDKAGTVVNQRMNEDNLGAELRAFRMSKNVVQEQSHGPLAKYGSAFISRGTTIARAGPDLPQPQAPSENRAITLEPLQASVTYYGAQGRSPDWFASHESPGNGRFVHEPHFHQVPTTPASGVGLLPDTRRWNNEGLYIEHSSPQHEGLYQDIPLCDTGAAYYVNGPCMVQAPIVPPATSLQQVHQHGQCNCAFCPARQTLAPGPERHEILPRAQTFPQYQSQHPVAYAPAAGPQTDRMLNYAPDPDLPDDEQWYEPVAEAPGTDDPSRYQQGMAELQTRILRYSSPGPSTQLQGFWQRNYL